MQPLNIIADWHWYPEGKIVVRVNKIEGGAIPSNIRHNLENHKWGYPNDLGKDSEAFKKALKVAEILSNRLPLPEPNDLGADNAFAGNIVGLQHVNFTVNEIHVCFYVKYDNLPDRVERPYNFQVTDLSDITQDLIKEINVSVKNHVMKWFVEKFNKGERNSDKWKAEKTRVFISYRSYAEEKALQLSSLLGNYEESSVFAPIIDKVDMRVGEWKDRLRQLITEAQVFVPLLTHDYLEVITNTKWELEEATLKNKKIVPILIEGSPEEYDWLSKIHMVIAKDGLESHLEGIARLALELTQKHNEFT